MEKPPGYRRSRDRSTTEYISFARRILATAAQRVGASDAPELAELLRLRRDLDEHITLAIATLREAGTTWQDIGDAAGTTRQAALMRWGPKIGGGDQAVAGKS